MTAPETAREAPTAIAATTRGSRMLMMAILIWGAPCPRNTCRIWGMLISREPLLMAKKAVNIVAMTATRKVILLRRINKS